MRRYLTKILWFEDRLSSLPSTALMVLSCLSLGGLGALTVWIGEFLEDLAQLLQENDPRLSLIVLGLLLLASAGVWLFSCSVAALGRRVVLSTRGL